MTLRLASACALAAVLVAATPGSAPAFEQIDATFLAEYGAEEYTIDQGEIVTFSNGDKFLSHGIVSGAGSGGLFSAPVIPSGGVRLLRGAPFLTAAGSPYEFHCPLHHGMSAVLEVTADGSPLPPDATAPSGLVRIKTASAAKLAHKRRLRLVLNPSEAVDVAVSAGVKGASFGKLERTYVTPGARAVTMKLSRTMARAVSGLSGRAAKLKVKVSLSDVAGNAAVVKASRRLRVPPPPAPKKPGKKD